MSDCDDMGLRIAEGQTKGRRVLRIEGELDLLTAPVLSRRLDQVPGDITIDLRDVQFMDCTGLNLLLQAGAGREIAVLRTADGIVDRLIAIAGVSDRFAAGPG